MVGQLETYPGGLTENIATLFGLPLAAVTVGVAVILTESV